MEKWSSVLVAMRVVRAESDGRLAAARRLIAPHGTIAVGGADFDEFVRGEALATLLGALSDGYYPSLAAVAAKMFARDAVRLHNAKRPRDVNWQRYDGTADLLIEHAIAAIVRASRTRCVALVQRNDVPEPCVRPPSEHCRGGDCDFGKCDLEHHAFTV